MRNDLSRYSPIEVLELFRQLAYVVFHFSFYCIRTLLVDEAWPPEKKPFPLTISFKLVSQYLRQAQRARQLMRADRLRRKNEALAQEIFGKGRRSSTPANGIRKLGPGASLASRVGIAKVRMSLNYNYQRYSFLT